jgi:hypothetical protein
MNPLIRMLLLLSILLLPLLASRLLAQTPQWDAEATAQPMPLRYPGHGYYAHRLLSPERRSGRLLHGGDDLR